MGNTKINPVLDPTEDFEDMINDSTGLSGVTKNANERIKKIRDEDDGSLQQASGTKIDISNDLSSPLDSEELISQSEEIVLDLDNPFPPSVLGEQSISGDMPDVEADDDVDRAAHEMGIGLDSDSQNPQELNIGGDIDKAEEYKRSH